MFRQLNIRLILKAAGVLLVCSVAIILLGKLLHTSAEARILPRARQLAEQEEYDEAVKLYEIHLARHRGNEEELVEFAHLLAKDGRRRHTQRLAEVCRRILELNPKNYDALEKLTEITLIAATMRIRFSPDAPNEWKAAADLAERMTRAAPEKPEGFLYLGRALDGLGQLADAKGVLERLITEHPGEEDAYFLLADIGERSGAPAAQWRRYIDEAVTKNPKSWSVHLKAHGFFAAHGEAESAQRSLRNALTLAPDEPSVLFAAGIAEERRGDHEAARQHWESLRSLAPSDCSADVALARLARAKGDATAALALLQEGVSRIEALEENLKRSDHPTLAERKAAERKAAELKAGKTELLFQVADLLIELGRTGEAAPYLDRLRAIAAASPHAAILEGQLSMVHGRFQAARPDLERAGRMLELGVRALPPLSRAHLLVGKHYYALRERYQLLGKCYILLGTCYARTGEPGAARAALAGAVGIWPTSFAARIGYAEALLSANELEAAAEQARLAAGLAEAEGRKRSVALLTLARALDGLTAGAKEPAKVREQALEAARKAVELHASSDALILLAQLYLNDGKASLAEEVLQRKPVDPDGAPKLRTALIRLYSTTKAADLARARLVYDAAVKQPGSTFELRLLRPLLLGPDASFEAKEKCLQEVLAQASEKDAPRAHLALAALYADHRKPQDAARHLRVIAAAEPDNTAVRRILFRLLLDSGDLAQTRAVVKELAGIEGENSPAVVCDRVECGLADADARKARQLAQELESLLKNTPCWRASALLGDIRRLEGKTIEAIACYKAAFEGNPTSVRAGLPLVRALNHAERYQEATVVLDRLLRLDPSSPTLLPPQIERFAREDDLEGAMAAMKRTLERQPESVPILLDLGNVLLAKRDFAEAEKWLRKAHELDPRNPSVVDRLVFLMDRMGREQEALDLCNAFVAAQPEEPRAYLSRSKHHLLLAHSGKAVEDLEHALTLTPKDKALQKDILIRLGDIAAQRADHDAAAARYRQAAALEPPGSVAREYLVERLLASGRQSHLAEASQVAKALLNEGPDNARVHVFMARIDAMDPDSVEQAKQHCRRAIELAPKMSQPHSVLSRIYLGEGDLRRATEEAGRAVACEPGSPAAQLRYVDLLRQQKRYNEARAVLDNAARSPQQALPVITAGAELAAAERGPRDAARLLEHALAAQGLGAAAESRLRLSLGQYLEEAGNASEAEAQLRKALGLRKDSLDALAALAKLLDSQKRFDETDGLIAKASREDMQKKTDGTDLLRAELLLARRRGPEDLAEAERLARRVVAGRPEWAAARHILGKIARERGDTEGAIASYRKALELDCANATIANDLAWLLCQAGQPQEALKLARNAVASDPTDPHFQDTLGEACFQLALYSEAAQAFARCAAASSDGKLTLYKLGRCLLKLGKNEEARDALRRALQPADGTAVLSEEQRNEARQLLESVDRSQKPS